MSIPYHKIQTVYLRDPETNHKTLLYGQYALPEFAALADLEWIWTEKVDGTNIRVIFDGHSVRYAGKTDNAQIDLRLMRWLEENLSADCFVEAGLEGPYTLYGEGYGARIQKGGGNYRDDQAFVLFDVMAGDWWLRLDDVDDVADHLGIESVPAIGLGTLGDMVKHVRSGELRSRWGDFPAEGIVARPPVDLWDRMGNRIITKVKLKDFALQKV